MSVQNFDRLTGGTLMLLLETAKKRSHKSRDSLAGKADGLNNQELLKALIRVFDPCYPDPAESTFGNNTSEYRSCRLKQGTYLPFDQENLVRQFDAEIQSTYRIPLARIHNLVDRFIDFEVKGEQLVSRLLGLILADCTISERQELFIHSDGKSCKKSGLRNITEIELDSLLLGAWHYVITEVPDNTVGRSTFEHWYTKPAILNSQWKLISSKLPTIDWGISVVRSAIAEDGGFEPEVGDSEVVKAEVIEEESTGNESSVPFPGSVAGASDSRITIFQGGTNNTNIGHVETLNLGR